MIDKRIKFDKRFDDTENGIIYLYFIAPKEMLYEFNIKEYVDAISMEICIEFSSKNHFDEPYLECSIAPTVEIDGVPSEIDWYDVSIPYDEIKELMNLYRKES